MRRLLRIRKTHKGGILIEFTFSIPVCISLLFFVNDHYRIYELNNKIKASTYLAASMVQHVTNTRADKQLTINDIRRITYASCFNLFHTNSMFYSYPFGIFYIVHFYYVKRLSSNSYQIQKIYAGTGGGNSPNNMVRSDVTILSRARVHAQEIHPDLVCQNDGEERVLIFPCYRRASGFDKSKLGFFIMNPPNARSADGQTTNICTFNLVITPKPGLFPVK